MDGFFLYGAGIPLAIWWSLIGGALLLAARAKGAWAVWCLSALAGAALGAVWLDLWGGCASDAEVVCTESYGLMVGLTSNLTIPVALIGQLLLSFWMAGRSR